jgi:endonuclease YncB( thermonuclease family)
MTFIKMHVQISKRTERWILLFVFLMMGVIGHAAASGAENDGEKIHADVEKIIDGDSLKVRKGNKTIELRLWGIDAPEFDQPGAAESEQALLAQIDKAQLTLEVKDIDKYGRLVVIAHKEHTNINEEMVKTGHAWVHIYYCLVPPCGQWRIYEKQARQHGIGFWQYKDPIPPWVWKASHKKKSSFGKK